VGDAALLNPLPVMGSALADGPGVMARSFARVNDAPRAANGRTPNRSCGTPPHGRLERLFPGLSRGHAKRG